MACSTGWLRRLIRDVPDFPEPGIGFKDIAPLIADVDAFRFCVDALADRFAGATIDRIVGIESRGFLFAAPLAYRFGAGLVPVRKPGKLPGPVETVEYQLEYGSDRLEIQSGAVGPGSRVLIVDDVLATGGTAAATASLVEGLGAEVVGLGFVIELGFLHGRQRLEGREVVALLEYAD
jgi:adenine phosphoribosyltransferase